MEGSESDRRARSARRSGVPDSSSAFADDAPLLQPGDDLSGRWRVGGKIGEGTFSRIYDAQPVQAAAASPAAAYAPPVAQHQPVVLKVNKRRPKANSTTAATAGEVSHLDDSFAHEAAVFRAVQAAEEAGQARQPRGAPPVPLAVPRLFDYQPVCTPVRACAPLRDASVEYMVLEKCGVDLSALRYDWLNRASTGLSVVSHAPAALELGVMCMTALEKFHRAGYVHRDIKPSNFLTCFHTADATQRVLITDFGLSRRRKQMEADAQAAAPTQQQQADNKFIGKSLYASFTAHRQETQSCRDDVCSLLFVLLDLMFGSLPWKSLCTNNGGGDKRSQQQRWDSVRARKEEMLGAEVCAATAQAVQQGLTPKPIDWLPDTPLPHVMHTIFHQLHSLPPGAEIKYADIRAQLRRLSEEMVTQLGIARRQWHPLTTLLDLHAKGRAAAAEAEAEKQRAIQAAQAAEERRLAAERALLEQAIRDREKKERADAEYSASMARKAEAAAAAEAAKQLAEKQRLERLTAAQTQQQLASRSAQQLLLDKASARARVPPPPYTIWSRRVRDLFGDLFQLHSLVHVVDVADPRGRTLTSHPMSLEALWSQVQWGKVGEAAALGTELLRVKFSHWHGEWTRVHQGLEHLSFEQLQGLKTYCSATPSPLPAQLAGCRTADNLVLVGVAANIAFLYELSQQAFKGTTRIPGFGRDPVTPAQRPATAAVGGAAPGRNGGGAAAEGTGGLGKIRKKVESINLVDGAAAAPTAAVSTPAVPAAAASSKTKEAAPAAAATAVATPARPATSIKTEQKSAPPKKDVHPLAKPVPPPESAASKGKGTLSTSTEGKKGALPVKKRVAVSSSSESSSDSGSSSSSESDGEPLVTGKPKKLQKLSKLSAKSSKPAAATPSSSAPKKAKRLRKLSAAASDDDEDDAGAAGDDDDDESEALRTATSKRQLALKELEAKQSAAKAAEEEQQLKGAMDKMRAAINAMTRTHKQVEFDVPESWRAAAVVPVAAAAAAADTDSSDATDADEDKMLLRAAFDKFRSTMGLWAWGADYDVWEVDVKDMLNRAMVLDALADMGADKPSNTKALNDNWRVRFDITDKKRAAPLDDDPEVEEIKRQYTASLPVSSDAGSTSESESESESDSNSKEKTSAPQSSKPSKSAPPTPVSAPAATPSQTAAKPSLSGSVKIADALKSAATSSTPSSSKPAASPSPKSGGALIPAITRGILARVQVDKSKVPPADSTTPSPSASPQASKAVEESATAAAVPSASSDAAGDKKRKAAAVAASAPAPAKKKGKLTTLAAKEEAAKEEATEKGEASDTRSDASLTGSKRKAETAAAAESPAPLAKRRLTRQGTK